MDKSYKIGLEQNFAKYHLATVLTASSALWVGFIFLFYAVIGLKIQQFGIIAAITSLTILLFEIPSGILADRFGRKKVLLLSAVFSMGTVTLLFFSNSFAWVALAAFMYGLQLSFKSGTDMALIYDSYKELNKADLFKSFRGKNFAYQEYALSISSIIAGYLAEIDFRVLFGVSIALSIAYALVIATLKEPLIHDKILPRASMHLFESMKEIISAKKVFMVFLYSLIIAGIVESIYLFHQVFAKEVGFSLPQVGLLFGLMFLVAGISSHLAKPIECKLGFYFSVLLVPIGLGLIYIAMGLTFTFFVGWFVLIESFVYGYFQPLIAELKNRFISSGKRATVLSISSFAENIFILLAGLLIGFGGALLGLSTVYILIGTFVLLFGIIIAFKLLKYLGS